MMFDLKGHIRSHEAFFCLGISFLLNINNKLNDNIMNTQFCNKRSQRSWKVLEGLLAKFFRAHLILINNFGEY